MLKFWPNFTRKEWYLVLALVIAYFATRLYHLTSLPIFVDEAIYSRWSQIALHDASWRFISLTDGKQPLWVWASMLPLKLISDPLFATRLTSVVSGLFTLLGVIYTGHLLGNKKLGFITAFLVLSSPFLFFYDRFAVMESMLAASGVWILNLGILLSLTPRLDIALILGLFGGLALLVKSPALIYLLLIPVSYPFLAPKPLKIKNITKFLILLTIGYLLSASIYNIQRLSPWMHMISDKNNDFVISPLQMLAEHPFRIWQNFADSMRWLSSYVTIPVLLTSLIGAGLLLAKDAKKFYLFSAWFWGPLMATVMMAMLFRPRYILFATPFVLFYAAYALSGLNTKKLTLSLLVLSLTPIYFMFKAYTSPLTMPLVKADSDYVSGWAAGNGVKEISAWLVNHAKETGKDLDVYTEGTFGLLPHGLELYTSPLTTHVRITGLYPIMSIPPLSVRQNAETNFETYFILNNTQVKELPPNSTEILSFKKADDSYIRLYHISP